MIIYDAKGEVMRMACDQCSVDAEFDGLWRECLNEAKRNGWSFHKQRGDWTNLCPVCAEVPEKVKQ